MALNPMQLKKHADAAKKSKPFGGKKPGGGPPPPSKHQAPPHGGGSDDDDEHDDADSKSGNSDEEMAAKIAAQVRSGKVDEDVTAAASGFEPTDGDDTPPPFVHPDQGDLWDRANAACGDYDGSDEYHWPTVIQMFKALGGKLEGHGGGEDDDAGSKSSASEDGHEPPEED